MKLQGSAQKAIETLSQILKLKGKVLPFTEDKVTLMGKMDDNSIIEGEHNITEYPKMKKEEVANVILDKIKSKPTGLILFSNGYDFLIFE